MKIKMRIFISGTHNGEPWPLPGQVVEVPDVLGAKLCANGSASPVAEGKAEEKAVTSDADVEKRGGLTKKTAAATTKSASAKDDQ